MKYYGKKFSLSMKTFCNRTLEGFELQKPARSLNPFRQNEIKYLKVFIGSENFSIPFLNLSSLPGYIDSDRAT
jgi:hypothetical protein